MKFIDICSGIGGFRKGLTLEGFEPVGFCERDKFAINSYRAMYDTKDEWFSDDIEKIDIDTMPYADMWCFGFPCQDVSVAGKQGGLHGERSGIYFKIIDLIKSKKEEDRPKLLFIENVKNLLSINKGHDFARVLFELDEAGYNARWKVLNSKGFRVPQKRERIFIIAYKKNLNIDVFEWPIETDYGIRLKDILEDEVDEKYYISEKATLGLLRALNRPHTPTMLDEKTENSPTIDSRVGSLTHRSPYFCVPVLTPDRVKKRQNGRRFKEDGEEMFTLTSQDRHGILQVGNLYENKCQAGRVYNTVGMAVTLTGLGGGLGAKTGLYLENCRIRRLTPKECFRLQGFSDELFEKAQIINSDTQLYKQAGNAVTVNVIQAIAKQLNKCLARR
jgi:DNA (cytosine-5)-methyltransferase 1